MLRELYLRDLGVIREAGVELSPGLNVVTGETGVGKTLLVTSLALLTGGRGHARLVAGGARDALVQAVVVPSPGARVVLEARGIDPGEEMMLVRRLAADGRSRAWLDDQLVPLSTLAEVGEGLVEIHGQGAGFALARPANQLAAIDALARNEDALASYRHHFGALRALELERDRLRTGDSDREREIELLAFQVDEIDRAELAPGDEEAIKAQLGRLEHAERLRSIAGEVQELIGSDGAAGRLAEARKAMEFAASVDPDTEDVASRLATILAEATEVAHDIRTWGSSLEVDPAQLEALRERKALIGNLKRKYGASIDEVLATADSGRARLAELGGRDDRVATIDTEIETERALVERLALALTKSRKRAAKDLTKLVMAELPALALPNATFEVTHGSTELGESGADRMGFAFSSSRSKAADEIGKIASGGELSRAMIAVTLALATTHEVPVLVFDEADQGIGGEAALELGRRLARLGRSHQVLVVSHLPQIAAFADRQIAVRREGDDVSIEVLSPEERLGEISRMLAGLESSDMARGHAAELLELASAER